MKTALVHIIKNIFGDTGDKNNFTRNPRNVSYHA